MTRLLLKAPTFAQEKIVHAVSLEVAKSAYLYCAVTGCAGSLKLLIIVVESYQCMMTSRLTKQGADTYYV